MAIVAGSGRSRRNFQGFTDDQAGALVGLGASAISQFDGLIVQNEKHVGRYRLRVENRLLPGTRGIARRPDDRFRGVIIERLLCDGMANLATIASAHGRDASELEPSIDRLGEFIGLGLVVIDGSRIAITPDGRPYARLVAAAFDSRRVPGDARFSKVV